MCLEVKRNLALVKSRMAVKVVCLNCLKYDDDIEKVVCDCGGVRPLVHHNYTDQGSEESRQQAQSEVLKLIYWLRQPNSKSLAEARSKYGRLASS